MSEPQPTTKTGSAPAAVGKAKIIHSAPAVPPGVYGRVTYDFQNGRLVLATIEEKIKPGTSEA